MVFSGLSLATVYYAMMWFTQQTSSGMLNPAVSMSQGFSDQWYYYFNIKYQENPLWDMYWVAWIIGPFIGASLAAATHDFFHDA